MRVPFSRSLEPTTRILNYCRAGNGTRTRDPNLGKVVLYQLSYSRVAPVRAREITETGISPRGGGEGNRTPDLVNAIHALSQLSYAPIMFARP